MLVAGILTMIALRSASGAALRATGHAHQLRWAIVTVMAVLALAFVMNASGQTITLGTWMAGAGGSSRCCPPILGWLGVAVTGSDTSSNSLFGALQVTAAGQARLSDPDGRRRTAPAACWARWSPRRTSRSPRRRSAWTARRATSSAGSSCWSLVFLALLCVLSALQSSTVLSWMVP